MTQAIRPGGPEAAWQRDTGLPETLKGSSTAFAMENSQLSSEQSRQLLQDPHQARVRQSSLRREWRPSNSKHLSDHIFPRIWAFPLLIHKNHKPDV